MANEDLLRAGISAARSGNLKHAASLLAEVVSTDPSSEQGWLWLATCLTDPDRQIYCLRRVLALNPNNYTAREELQSLTGVVGDSPQKTGSSKQEAVSRGRKAGMSRKSRVVRPEPGGVSRETDDSRISISDFSPPAINHQSAPPKRKKPNKLLIALLLIIPALAICGLGAAYMFMSGRMSELFSPGLST